MKLTDKTKKDFEKWYWDNVAQIELYEIDNRAWVQTIEIYDVWQNIPESMQWGVLQDFADSKGYDVDATKFTGCLTVPDFFIVWVDEDLDMEKATRPEARTAAIEKFNEIYNQA
ncbi:MAG: hypothetical protein COA36_16750 [Desulfotalea sp.]|nr:MAG: hypothetical protein COA36_16750 [Desulfotalea sp.]